MMGEFEKVNIEGMLVLPGIFDAEVYWGEGALARAVARDSTTYCETVLLMPKMNAVMRNGEDVESYRLNAWRAGGVHDECRLLSAFQVTPQTTIDEVAALAAANVVAGVVYPVHVAGLPHGVIDYRALYPILAEMEKRDLVLCLYGESPREDVFCLDKEREFLPLLIEIATTFPKLRIVLQQITTAEAIHVVCRLGPQVAATVSLYHLMFTLDDILTYSVGSLPLSWPLPKRSRDRAAIRRFAMSGNPKALLGSGTTPHSWNFSGDSDRQVGVLSAPVLMEGYATEFEREGKLDKLRSFVEAGINFYGLPPSRFSTNLIRETWTVPNEIDGIVPFMAGKQLPWRVIA